MRKWLVVLGLIVVVVFGVKSEVSGCYWSYVYGCVGSCGGGKVCRAVSYGVCVCVLPTSSPTPNPPTPTPRPPTPTPTQAGGGVGGPGCCEQTSQCVCPVNPCSTYCEYNCGTSRACSDCRSKGQGLCFFTNPTVIPTEYQCQGWGPSTNGERINEWGTARIRSFVEQIR